MSPLHPATLARINAQITAKERQLALANTAYEAALGDANVKFYAFDSGEGKQSATRRDPAQIRKEITNLERELERLYARRDGRGIVSMNLRRQ